MEVMSIGDVCDFSRGLTYKKADEVSTSSNGVLRANNVTLETGKINFDDIKYISDEIPIPRSKKVKKGSLLICTASGSKKHLGKVALIESDIDFAYGGFMGMLTPKNNIDSKYLYWLTQSKTYFDFIQGLTDGANINNLKFSQLKYFPVPVCLLEEQKRIVAILDQAFADLEQVRAKTEQNLKNARELFDSYLQQVFSQRGEGWVVKSLDSFSNIVNGHAFKSVDFSPNHSVKSIKITNVGVFEFVEESDNLLPEDYLDKYSQYKAYEGDVVVALTRTIISTGLKVAVVPFSYNGALINQRVAAVHVNEEIMPKEMLQAFLSTKMAIDYVRSNVNELMQPNLSIKDLKAFPIPIPPPDKKESVKNELAVILEQKDKLVDIYNKKLNVLDELKKSILQKAFSGELTAKAE
jgi:type I restriction enzyme S subunit